VGGSIGGLHGVGLRLDLNDGAQKLVVTGDGTWTFEHPVAEESDYEVTVDRQPSGPTEHCTVEDGEGVVRGGNIAGVRLTCVPASKVTLDIEAPDSDGAGIRALLISTAGSGSRVVGREPDRAKLQGGRATFVMIEPGGEKDDEATLVPGEYHLYVMVNHDGDFDTESAGARFDLGDVGAYRRVSATSEDPPTVYLGPGDLAVTTDYRDVLAEVVSKRLNNAAVDQIFPNYKATVRNILR
jgi:hypothetical protein